MISGCWIGHVNSSADLWVCISKCVSCLLLEPSLARALSGGACMLHTLSGSVTNYGNVMEPAASVRLVLLSAPTWNLGQTETEGERERGTGFGQLRLEAISPVLEVPRQCLPVHLVQLLHVIRMYSDDIGRYILCSGICPNIGRAKLGRHFDIIPLGSRQCSLEFG
jgi:hypothetical protein